MNVRLVIALVLAVLAASCSSAEDPFEREAAAVVERAESSASSSEATASPESVATPEAVVSVDSQDGADEGDPAAATEGCVIETVEDEYGLDVEIEVCPGDDEAAPTPSVGTRTGLLADPWFGSNDSKTLTTAVTLRVLNPCVADQPSYPELPVNVETAIAGVLAGIDEIQSHCGDAEQFRLANHSLFGEIEATSTELLGRGPRTAVLARSDEQLAAQAVEHLEWLGWVLAGATRIVSHRTDLWAGSATRGHIMATAGSEGADTLILGNSQTHFGVNPEGLTGSAYNASVPGSGPAAYVALYDYFGATAGLDPNQVVLGLSAVDFVVGTRAGCARDTAAPINAMFALHNNLYPESPLDLDGLTMDRLLARPTLRQSLQRTALAVDHNRRVSEVGAGLEFAELDDEARARRFAIRSAIFEAWIECPARFRDLTRFLNTANRRNDQVLVVLMPLHPDVIAAAPDQSASVAELNSRVIAAVEESGGTVLDLTNRLTAAEMIDSVHPSEAGAARVTEAVAAALDAG